MTALQEAFPLDISEEQLAKYPKFSSLLTWLSDKITSCGLGQATRRDLDLAQRSVSQAHYNWLTNSIIYNELGEILVDLEIQSKDGTMSMDEKQFTHILSKTLAFNEIGDYIHHVPSTSSSTLFGMSDEDIDRHNPVKHHLSTVHQIVVPMLEDKLRRKCEELYLFHEPTKNQDSSSAHLMAAKAQSLPSPVEQKKADLTLIEEKLKQDRQRQDKQFWSYYQKLLESLSVMETLIKEFRLNTQAKTDVSCVGWLKARSDALCLKIRLTQMQIICDTYTKETVKALKKTGIHLDNAIQQTEREMAATAQSLQTYHTIGTEFQVLIKEYTQLQLEIENRKWGLQNLVRNDDKHDVQEFPREGTLTSVSSSSSKTSELLDRAISEVGRANNQGGIPNPESSHQPRQ